MTRRSAFAFALELAALGGVLASRNAWAQAVTPSPTTDADQEVRVRAGPRPPWTSTEVVTGEAHQVPGTQGDVLRVVESLPGVGRMAPGSGQLVVWGAAPQDTRVYVDGLPVPRLYHDGGYRSVIHADMVSSVELLPGGYGPTYGRGLGGVIAVKQRRPDESGMHGSVAADVLDASASIRAAITRRWWLALAVRRSHLDEVLSVAGRQDVAEIVPVPRYHDGYVRASYAISDDERVELGGVLSGDSTTRAIFSADPLATRSERRDVDWSRAYVRYEKQLGDGSGATVLPFVGLERSRLVGRFGATPVAIDVASRVFGLRAAWRGTLVRNIRATVGLDAQFTASDAERVGSIGTPSREGDVRHFGQRPPEQLNADAFKNVIGSFAPYGELDIPLLDGLFHVVPGARVEPYLTTTNRKTPKVGEVPALGSSRQETVVEPRLAVRFAPNARVAMSAAYGSYHQAPLPEDLSAVFGTPALGVARAEHWTLGCSFKPVPSVDVELTNFFVESSDLVTRSRARFPPLAEALEQTGAGRTVGMQVLVRRRRVGPLFGWLAYTLSRSQRRDASDGSWRFFDYDQTHVLTAVVAYDLGWGFDVGLRARYATGFPRTPVTSASYDDKSDTYVPRFGSVNSTRIPSFFALDARAAKHFKVGAAEAEIYLEVLNSTNHENAEEIAYSTTYRRRGSITGLPILPVAGARLSW